MPVVDAAEIVYDCADMVLLVIYFGRSHISAVYGNNGPGLGFTTVDLVAIKDLAACREGPSYTLHTTLAIRRNK